MYRSILVYLATIFLFVTAARMTEQEWKQKEEWAKQEWISQSKLRIEFLNDRIANETEPKMIQHYEKLIADVKSDLERWT